MLALQWRNLHDNHSACTSMHRRYRAYSSWSMKVLSCLRTSLCSLRSTCILFWRWSCTFRSPRSSSSLQWPTVHVHEWSQHISILYNTLMKFKYCIQATVHVQWNNQHAAHTRGGTLRRSCILTSNSSFSVLSSSVPLSCLFSRLTGVMVDLHRILLDTRLTTPLVLVPDLVSALPTSSSPSLVVLCGGMSTNVLSLLCSSSCGTSSPIAFHRSTCVHGIHRSANEINLVQYTLVQEHAVHKMHSKHINNRLHQSRNYTHRIHTHQSRKMYYM